MKKYVHTQGQCVIEFPLWINKQSTLTVNIISVLFGLNKVPIGLIQKYLREATFFLLLKLVIYLNPWFSFKPKRVYLFFPSHWVLDWLVILVLLLTPAGKHRWWKWRKFISLSCVCACFLNNTLVTLIMIHMIIWFRGPVQKHLKTNILFETVCVSKCRNPDFAFVSIINVNIIT